MKDLLYLRAVSTGEREFTGTELRNYMDGIAEVEPRLCRLAYPRHYEEPSGCGQYFSPRFPASQIVSNSLKVMSGTNGEGELYQFVAMSHLVRYGVPMYWLGKDLSQAIRKTAPPQKFDWYNMPLPFPACVFMLPKGCLRNDAEGEVAFVAYARLHSGDEFESKLIPGKQYGITNGSFILMAGMVNGALCHWNIPVDAYGSYLSIPDIATLMDQHKNNVHKGGFWEREGVTMTPADNQLGLEVMHLVFSTLFVMEARPELVTTGSLKKKVTAKKGKTAKEFWNPNVIGEHYKIRREGIHGDGTHASPRFHWVCGAMKQQPYGPGRSLRKTIWIEPYTRGV